MLEPHRLSFAVQPFEGTLSVTPAIDGILLSKLVLSFEKDHQFEPAGGYGGIIPAWFNHRPLSQYFLGQFEEGSYFSKVGRIYVLGCQCGEVGCWPLVCEVHHEKGKVIWDSFQQPHRKDRDYSNFGPFVFAEQQYRDALQTLDRRLLESRAETESN